MDRQGDHFGYMATRSRVAQQPVDPLLRGSRMQLSTIPLGLNLHGKRAFQECIGRLSANNQKYGNSPRV
jgi:hypothetical protein